LYWYGTFIDWSYRCVELNFQPHQVARALSGGSFDKLLVNYLTVW